ncbi:hypothetical protein SARC_05242 [Sphaeroforma arctica JP610]|uniref:Uncharacterized protein n=1 Tax=Sphaeroforma arctica JP610 TaxID=667725 RepID=A0A0L0G029_9EUKA|nr:hypothetical protein SARC_05242 [Sphaeroforma arctica JP610]KNC82472.1 hypothetical protein SARC_05242 [Sphaeroforma arctica JP610]|eukprot:XP_014156374.1 hypothetical protein SARC_05242 [Sphaeroforma arctica JP610]
MNGVRSNWEVDALLRQQKEKLQSKRAQRAEARMRHEAEKKLLKSQWCCLHRLKFLLEENKRHKAANAQLVRQTNQQHREMEAALADKRLELAIEQHKRKERDAETAKANANAQVPTEQVDVADNGLQEDEEAPRFTLQELSDRIRTEERNIRTYHRKITNTKENLRKNKTDLQQKELKYNAIVAQRDEKEIRRQELEVKISSLRKELGT